MRRRMTMPPARRDEPSVARPAPALDPIGGHAGEDDARADRSGSVARVRSAQEPTRGGGPRPLATWLPKLAGQALGRKALAFGSLIRDWPSLVGPRLAAHTLPLKLSFPPGRKREGVLQLRVSGAAALDVQHSEPHIVERLNGFFGYRAVARLKLIQATMPRAAKQSRPGPPDATVRQEVERLTAGVDDDALREALDCLGQAVLGRPRT